MVSPDTIRSERDFNYKRYLLSSLLTGRKAYLFFFHFFNPMPMFSVAYYEAFSRLFSMRQSILMEHELRSLLSLYGDSLSSTERYLLNIWSLKFKKL